MPNGFYFAATEAAESTTLGTAIFVTASFLLLLLLLKIFAWGPITNIFQQRAEKVASDLDSAETNRNEAEKLVQESQKNLQASKTEALSIVKNAKEIAEETRKTLIQETSDELVVMKQRAKEALENDKELAFQAVRKDVASLSLELAEKILKQELTTANHEALIDAYIEGLEKP